MQHPIHYSVIPTYTPGSPAGVDERIAKQVAREERVGHERALTGIYSDKAATAASERGVDGIAYMWQEYKKGAIVEDLITEERHTFITFEQFREWGAAQRKASAKYRECGA